MPLCAHFLDSQQQCGVSWGGPHTLAVQDLMPVKVIGRGVVLQLFSTSNLQPAGQLAEVRFTMDEKTVTELTSLPCKSYYG